jgi:hypothetical protein
MSANFQKWFKESGFLIIINLLISQLVEAQPFTLQAEMELNRGLRHNSVRTIIQDSKQRTYLGTESGLIILQSDDAFLDSIARYNEKKAIVSLNILDDLLFIGTVADGLKIYDLKRKIEIHSPFMDSIRYVRHIRKLGNEIFIAANGSSWNVKRKEKKIYFQKIHRPSNTGFFTDFYSIENRIFGFDLNSTDFERRIYEIKGKKATPTKYPAGYPPNPILTILTALNNDSISISAGDGFYHVVEANGKSNFKLLNDSVNKLNYPVWDIAIAKKKLFLALGQQFLLTTGLTYEVGVNTINEVRSDFFCQSLYYNEKQDALWIGTYNRGLFIWPNVSLSTKIPKLLDGTFKIIPGKKDHFYLNNEDKIYSLNTTNNQIDLIINDKYDKKSNNIINVDYWKDTLAVLSPSALTYFNSNGKEIAKYPFPNYQFVHHRQLGDSIFFFTQHNGGFFVQHKNDIERKRIEGITISPKSKSYYRGFVFFSDEKGFYYHDSTTRALQSPLTKIEDFLIIGNKVWTLNAGRVQSFKIEIDSSKLIPETEIAISSTIDGFIPNWIRSSRDKILIGNNKGVIKLNSKTGAPEWYSYLGNYTANNYPIIYNDTLLMVQDQYLESHPMRQPYKKADLEGFKINLERKDGLFERFPIEFQLNHSDYFLQNYSLKKIEIKDDDGNVQIYFTLTDKFKFPSGLKRGKYEVSFFVNNHFIEKMTFKVTIPLLENPLFYLIVASFVIFMLFLILRFRNKKQQLERYMLENRLQLLKKNLDPHFIFNSLNLTYMLLLQEKNKEAIDSITQFSELHRYFLETINKNEIALADELKFIKNYLELEKKKSYLDEPFSYLITPIEEKLSRVFIPPMILHPLVENAVKYCGFDPAKTDQGTIKIDIEIFEKHTTISIENSLPIKEKNNTIGYKKGIEIVRETIAIYNSMGQYNLKFSPNEKPILTLPGYRCEVIVFLKKPRLII